MATSLLLVLVALATGAAPETAAGPPAEVKASSWGFDPQDSTGALQAAIRSGARKVIVEAMPTPWIVDRIELASDQEIVFEKGAVIQAKRGAFRGKGDCLFTGSLLRNVTLTGYGATFRMWKQDYAKPPYDKAEWRHCLSILSSSDVRVLGLTLAESGGDGIYLGVSKAGVTNKGILIRDVVSDGNHRQGISVISAEDLLIENCVLRNTAGTAPQAGIDFEPNLANERLVNCVMRNCVTENNAGDGFEFYLKNLTGASPPVSIRLENCRSIGDRRCALRWIARNGGREGSTAGRGEFVGCSFSRCGDAGIWIGDNAAAACRLRFERCEIEGAALDKHPVAPISIAASAGSTEDVGGVDFVRCTIKDTVERRPLGFVDRAFFGGGARLVKVAGSLVVERGGTETEYTLDEKTLASWFPRVAFKEFAPCSLEKVRLEPAFPSAAVPGTASYPWRHRERAEYLIWARAGADVTFTVHALPVGRGSGANAGLRLFGPSGAAIPIADAPPARLTAYTVRAAETGPYRIIAEPGSDTVRLASATHGICAVAGQGGLHFFGSAGDFVFWVPAGVTEFGVKVRGADSGERLKAEVIGPTGSVSQVKDSIAQAHQFVVTRKDAAWGEAWTLRVGKPSEGVLEDYWVELEGIPPLLAPAREALLAPAP